MMESMLEKGITIMGATRKAFDKFGKRMWTATPTRDMSKKDGSMGAKKPAAPYDSNTQRTGSY